MTPRVALAAAGLLLLAGCGGHAQAQLARGRNVFDARCGRCHTLTGRDSGASGGDLATAPLTAAQVADFTRVMPVRLSAADVAAVSAYVARRDGAARRRPH